MTRAWPAAGAGGGRPARDTANFNVNGRAVALVTFNVRDYGAAASQFGVEVLLPREAIARIRR